MIHLWLKCMEEEISNAPHKLTQGSLFSFIKPAKLCGLILRSQLIVLLKHKVLQKEADCHFIYFIIVPFLDELVTVCHAAVIAGVCGVGPVPADPEEAPAEGFQRRLSPFPPDPEHPCVPGREGVYDGPH